MAYNFKNLADVELLNAMPEEANVVVEVNGKTKRAPNIDVEAKIVASETLEEVPEGATVLAEVNGEIKRVPSAGLGGGKTLIIKSSDFDNAMAGVAAAGAEAADPVTYSANMTYDEVVAALANCELADARLFFVVDFPTTVPVVMTVYNMSTYTAPCLVMIASTMSGMLQLYWTAVDGISTTAPEKPAA
jgi:hypothetical protein